jgi:carbon monoxide dehydrogenase subunit G
MTITKHIAAPPSEVFRCITDVPNWANTISGIKHVEVLTDGPIGKGTRFRETRIMFKKEATEEMEIVDWQEGKSYSVGCESCGARYLSRFDVEAQGDGSDVTMTMDVQPVTFMAKLMSPLGKLMAGSMKKCIAKDLDDIKDRLEGSVGAA